MSALKEKPVPDAPPIPSRMPSGRPSVPAMVEFAEWLARQAGGQAAEILKAIDAKGRTESTVLYTLREAAEAALEQSRLNRVERKHVLGFLTAYPEKPGNRAEEPRDQRLATSLTKGEKTKFELIAEGQGLKGSSLLRDLVLARIAQEEGEE